MTIQILGKEEIMSSVIRIDDEVMNALKNRAIDFGLVFEPPNATLRKILNLDTKETTAETNQDNMENVNRQLVNRKNFVDSRKNDWPMDLMNCIRRLHKPVFSLDEVYEFEEELQSKYPKNHHIRDTIRATLQTLRNQNVLDFMEPWEYRIKND
jgi:hypothetical protein